MQVPKNNSNAHGVRLSVNVNWCKSIEISGICLSTSWHLDAPLEKKMK